MHPMRLPWLIAAALTALLALSAASTADTTLIVTGSIAEMYPPLTDELEPTAAERFEARLRELKESEPDAVFLHAGRHISINNAVETAYTFAHSRIFSEIGFSAVNLDSRDAALGTVSTIGYRYPGDGAQTPLLTGLEAIDPDPMGLPAARLVTRDDGPDLALVSLTGNRAISSLASFLAFTREVTAEALKAQMPTGGSTLVVAFSSKEAHERDSYLAAASVSPDLVLDWTLAAGAAPVKQGSAWGVAPPAAGEILKLTLSGAHGSLARPEVERLRYLDEDDAAKLLKFPPARLGLPIPNFSEVVGQYFTTEQNAIRVDTIPPTGHEELTSLGDGLQVHVYLLELPENSLRIYRSFGRMPDYERPDSFLSWTVCDMLIVLKADHSFERVIARHNFPVGGRETTILEALNKLSGTDAASWLPDPVLTAGSEELWRWAVHDIKNAMELDRRLYGVGGFFHVGTW